MTAIALSKSSRVLGKNLENGRYHTNRGKAEVFAINTLHTDVPVKKGTELGRSQISEAVEIINNQDLISDKNEEIAQVFSLQESLQSEKDIKQHVAPTSRPDLEKELVNLLLLHKAAVALPGDALGKTTLLQHKIKLKPGTQPICIPAYGLSHSKLATVDKLIDVMLSRCHRT